MHTANLANSNSRSSSLDIAKGIAIVLMILGHAEIILNQAAYFPLAVRFRDYEPISDLYNFWLYQAQSSVDAFYMFAGLSLALATRNKDKHWMIRNKLWRKAILLIVLDLTVVSWSFGNSVANLTPEFGSLSSFALSFICMSFLLSFPSYVVGCLAIAILIVRELVVIREPFDADSVWSLIYGLIWGPIQGTGWSALFSLTSWLPIVLLGFCMGRLLIKNPKIFSVHRLAIMTLALFATFIISRLFLRFGSLGQPLPETVTQIFQLNKYPASIHFHLLNLGWAFFYLCLGKCLERLEFFKGLNEQLIILGRHMLVCFVGHLFLLAVLKFSGFHRVFNNQNYSAGFGFVIVMLAVLGFLHWYTQAPSAHHPMTKKEPNTVAA